MRNIATVFLLFATILLPVQGSGQPQKPSVDPHLEVLTRYSSSIKNIYLETLNERVGEMNYAFTFKSIKTKPSNSDTTRIHPEDRPSEEQWFEVVLVIDSDCDLSPFWKNICQNVRGAQFIYGSPESKPKIIIRDSPALDDTQRGLSLVREMSFLEETEDIPCPDCTEEEADAREHSVKKSRAQQLLDELTGTAR